MVKGGRRWAIFAILSSMFIISQFYRVSNAVIAPELVRDLGLSAEQLGLLGGAFFYSFAIAQIPMGTAIDRVGPRLMIGCLPLIAALGTFLFCSSHSLALALFARLLIGVGMACVLMGTFKLYTAWFPPDEFATMIGLTYSVGAIGNILATSPLAYFVSLVGWRIAFFVVGVVTACLCVIVLKVVRDRPEASEVDCLEGDPARTEEQIPILRSLRMVSRNLTFWQISTATFFRYGTFVAIQGLWGGPYLIEILGYSPVRAGNILMMMSVGGIIGAPLGGRLSDKVLVSRKKVVILGMSAFAVGCLFLTGWTRMSHEAFYYGLFFGMGFFTSFGMVLYSHIKEIFDTQMAATAMTAINFFTMMGAAVFMQGMGRIIEAFPRAGNAYAPIAYHVTFLSCLFGIAMAIAFYGMARDTRPSGGTALDHSERSES